MSAANVKKRVRFIRGLLVWLIAGVLVLTSFGWPDTQPASAQEQLPPPDSAGQEMAFSMYLPYVRSAQVETPFGVEIRAKVLENEGLSSRTNHLNPSWMRINRRVSWRALQPTEDSPLQWHVMADFEKEAIKMKMAGIKPIVVINDFPQWAVVERPGGLFSYCGPLRADKFAAFASFMQQVVARYSVGLYNVHNWELGNEPDVDPDLLPSGDIVFGCWGDIDDPTYGGRHYGNMLNAVGPAIRAADPKAKIWLGGLLLDSPNTTDPKKGKPELFLKGILEAGAQANFDYVSYHWYTTYHGQELDFDVNPNSPWYALGGGTIGKAKFLRQQMAEKGIDKPLIITETALTCSDTVCTSDATYNSFFQAQANFLVRSMVRGLSVSVQGFAWYTLESPGWLNSGLLHLNREPRPAFNAYRQLIQQVGNNPYVGQVSYGTQFEAYAFQKGSQQVHVVWSKAGTPGVVSVPQWKLVEARSRDGVVLQPSVSSGNYLISIQKFEPVYLTVQP